MFGFKKKKLGFPKTESWVFQKKKLGFQKNKLGFSKRKRLDFPKKNKRQKKKAEFPKNIYIGSRINSRNSKKG